MRLITDERVRKVNFTGSTTVGTIVAAKAAQYCKPVLLELGGKSVQLVLEDADLDKAAEAASTASFAHVRGYYCFFWRLLSGSRSSQPANVVIQHGQVCMSTERILVSNAVLDQFAEKLAYHASRARVTPGASVEHISKISKLLEDAEKKGAKVLGGSERLEHKGSYLSPSNSARCLSGRRYLAHRDFCSHLAASAIQYTRRGDRISQREPIRVIR